MTHNAINKYEGVLFPYEKNVNISDFEDDDELVLNPITSTVFPNPHNYISNNPNEAKLFIAMTLSLLSGLILVIFD